MLSRSQDCCNEINLICQAKYNFNSPRLSNPLKQEREKSQLKTYVRMRLLDLG